jgi:hypothetical protein
MLGELLVESKGKITGQRVLSVENGIPKLEVLLQVWDICGNLDGNFLMIPCAKIIAP